MDNQKSVPMAFDAHGYFTILFTGGRQSGKSALLQRYTSLPENGNATLSVTASGKAYIFDCFEARGIDCPCRPDVICYLIAATAADEVDRLKLTYTMVRRQYGDVPFFVILSKYDLADHPVRWHVHLSEWCKVRGITFLRMSNTIEAHSAMPWTSLLRQLVAIEGIMPPLTVRAVEGL